MEGITFTRENVFRGWGEKESSRIGGVVREEHESLKEEPRVEQLRKWIAQYHTSEANEPYFYSVRKILLVDIAKESQRSKEKLLFILTMLFCVGVSVIVFWTTRSYFENAWKACQAIADKGGYVIKKNYLFERYATAYDVWVYHPTARSASLFLLRNAFCCLFPLGGLWGWTLLHPSNQAREIRCYNLVIDRSKDERVCPSNFDIQRESDPLTQETIPIEKLHSPQMIYLPNYVTEAKSFVRALLVAGEKGFSDPFYRRNFSIEERKEILSQIERIFLISEERFKRCFEDDDIWEIGLDNIDPERYLEDERVFDARGQFSTDAEHHLRMAGYDIPFLISQIDRLANQVSDVQQRERARRVIGLNYLAEYINSLRQDDRVSFRISTFEQETGVLLKDSMASS